MSAGLKGKVVIVTGATSGIGLATARILHWQGARVVIVGHRQQRLDQVASELPGSIVICADMTKPGEVQTMVESVQVKAGPIDVLINNAGQGYLGPVAEADADTYDYLFRLNVSGPLAAMHEAVPFMRENGGGRIINICSPVAKLALPSLGVYASTKAALRTMSLTARKELAQDGIAVSLFYPFITSSSFGENTLHAADASDAVPPGFMRNMPEPDTPEYVAGKLVAAIGSTKKEVYARPGWYFLVGMIRKRLRRRSAVSRHVAA